MSISLRTYIFVFGLSTCLFAVTHASTGASEDELDTDGLFDDEYGFEVDLDSDEDAGADAQGKFDSSPVKRFFDGRITYQQELSYNWTSPASIETNRSSIQLEWQKNMPHRLYAHLDLKYNVFWHNDIQVDSSESIDDGWNVRNVFLQKSWADTSLSVGHQIEVWGESETSVVTDVFSPRNQSDFIYTSLEDSRLSQLIFKLDHYAPLGRFTIFYNPNPEVDDNPLAADLPARLMLQRADIDLSAEYAMRWKKSIGRGDFSLFAADLADNNVTYRFIETVDDEPLVAARYNRYQMLGGSVNYTFGNSALQTEFAYDKDRGFQTNAPYSTENNGVFFTDQVKFALSVSHTQNSARRWLLGVSRPFIRSGNEYFSKSEHEAIDLVFNLSETFLYDTLDIGYTFIYDFGTKTLLHKIASDYDVTDNFSLGLSLFHLDNPNSEEGEAQSSISTRIRYVF